MRQKCMINFLSAAPLLRCCFNAHPPLSGDAATINCTLSHRASCAELDSRKDCNRVRVNRQSTFKVTIRWLTIREYNSIFAWRVFAQKRLNSTVFNQNNNKNKCMNKNIMHYNYFVEYNLQIMPRRNQRQCSLDNSMNFATLLSSGVKRIGASRSQGRFFPYLYSALLKYNKQMFISTTILIILNNLITIIMNVFYSTAEGLL